VFDNEFALGGFQSVDGGTFVLSAVPEPRTAGLLCAGLLVLGLAVRRQRI